MQGVAGFHGQLRLCRLWVYVSQPRPCDQGQRWSSPGSAGWGILEDQGKGAARRGRAFLEKSTGPHNSVKPHANVASDAISAPQAYKALRDFHGIRLPHMKELVHRHREDPDMCQGSIE